MVRRPKSTPAPAATAAATAPASHDRTPAKPSGHAVVRTYNADGELCNA